jgi:glucokinase
MSQDRGAFIGLDIGNTRLTVGVARRDGVLVHSAEHPAPSDEGAAAAVPRLIAMAEEACAAARAQGHEPVAIGLGFGGPVDYERQATRRSFHSPGWEGLPLAEVFAERFRLPARLDNDANAGGLGEALFGAAKGFRSSLYVNVGTGIGGAIVIADDLHHGATGVAGEIGHTVIDPDGPPCNCGKRGCTEALASGTAIARRARAAGVRGASPAGPTGREVMAAAQQGDATCREVVRAAANDLGLAIANAVSVLDPGIVVIGGGVAEAGDIWFQPLRESFARHAVSPPAQCTRLVPAGLGYHAGVLGAAALAITAFEAGTRRG